MKYDAILYFQQPILEHDERILPGRIMGTSDTGPNGIAGRDDPKMYSSQNFGKVIQDKLNNIGNGYYAEVTDFGKYIVITVGYHNVITGRSATKHFLTVFDGKLGNGLIMSSHSRWRSISGVSQAADYIRSAVNNLKNLTSN